MGQTAPKLKPEDLKSDQKVIVYGHLDCPYCVKVKAIFEEDFHATIDFRNTMQS